MAPRFVGFLRPGGRAKAEDQINEGHHAEEAALAHVDPVPQKLVAHTFNPSRTPQDLGYSAVFFLCPGAEGKPKRFFEEKDAHEKCNLGREKTGSGTLIRPEMSQFRMRPLWGEASVLPRENVQNG